MPRRVLDTRETRTPVGPGGTVDVRVTGQPCRSACAPPPDASNLNLTTGETVPNAVIVPVGRDGKVTLANSGGSVHLLVDVGGYFTADAGDGFASAAPHRILDTRSGLGASQARVGPEGTVDLQVTGSLVDADGGTVSVPATATAVVLNLTATGVSATTDVRAYPRPDDDRVPLVSNLNLRRGQTAASLVTVAVGRDGQVRLRNAAGQTDLVADLAGWYDPTAPSRFVPTSLRRVLDTRSGVGAARLQTGPAEALQLALAGRVGVPSAATAAVLNLTGTGATSSTDVRAYPADATAVPTVSSLNLTAGATRANLAVVPLGAGAVRLRNAGGTVSLIADLAGWFVPG